MSAAPQRLEVDGLPVSVTPGAGDELLLLLRMASPDSGVWDGVRSELAKHFTVASPDFSRLPGPLSLDDPRTAFDDLGRRAMSLIPELGFERAHLFGWNGGTLITLAAALGQPDRAASLVLVDPFFPLDDTRALDHAVRVKRTLFEHDRALYAWYWVVAGLSDRFIAEHPQRVEDLHRARLARDSFLQQSPERFEAWVRGLRETRFTDTELARLTMSAVILATGLDRWLAGPSVAMAQALAARLPGASLDVLDGVGGHVLVEAPERVIDALRARLGSAAINGAGPT